MDICFFIAEKALSMEGSDLLYSTVNTYLSNFSYIGGGASRSLARFSHGFDNNVSFIKDYFYKGF